MPVSLTSTKMNLGLRQTEEWINEALLPRADALARLLFCACLPHPLLPLGAELLEGTGMSVGAQNVWYEEGPFTGEVSAGLLAEVGCTHVMVGHAERRHLFAEDDRLVGRKARAAVHAGLVPVICVGEDEHLGRAETVAHVRRQASAVLDVLAPDATAILLYEPVWAIGSAQGADPHQAAAVLEALRRAASAHDAVGMIYGGAVVPGVYTSLRRLAPWDGVAIGRAAQDTTMLDEMLGELLEPMHRGPGSDG
ncbi:MULTISPECIES: triose-phosphate isomerase [unclassified Streptomyces]|uniref:triose-phosphate isomerase n=1 Tax=unclassified Streptomyces TaxID=2593676 RepID=UPI0036648523